MLEVVDELERNGHNLQHFSRELARYFRNLLVARISGADTRLVAASAAEREKLAEIASRNSPKRTSPATCSSRSICSAICSFPCNRASTWKSAWSAWCKPAACCPSKKRWRSLRRRLVPDLPTPAASRPARHHRRAPAPRPSISTAPRRPPQPPPTGDPRERLHSYLHEKGLTHLADAVENARITVSGADLNVVAPKSYALYFNDRAMADAAREVFGRPLRVKFAADDAGEPAAPPTPAAGSERRRSHRPRAGQPRGPALPGSVWRRNPQSSKPQGVAT